ncbi:agmatine deiminase family protein [Eubacteriaceae bacterium ES2]|nr:agmatine deiminase family protein [Eubacteriaceae bacterium ES2]
MQQNASYYMPPEWALHESTIIEWPVKESLVFPDNYDEVLNGYTSAIQAISEFEPVTLIVNHDAFKEAKSRCGNQIDYVIISHNDGWCRDNGPTIVINNNGERRGINWKFNAWGEKYHPFDLDNEVAPKILKNYNIDCLDSPLVLEGGSIHVDGQGTLLTTEECLLNKNRNPLFAKNIIERELKNQLGISQIIWLKRGLFGDETDGHIDNLACFSKPGTILLQTSFNKGDINHGRTMENLSILNSSRDANGRLPEIVFIDQPPARVYRKKLLPLSYLNFYIVNGGIILPVFGGDAKKYDENAISILGEQFPDHKIVTLDGMALIKEGGNIHCITQQIPSRIKKTKNTESKL